jgi:hypothetical protein
LDYSSNDAGGGTMSKTHIFAAHAQVPAGTDLYERHKYLSLVVTVNLISGEIVDCCIPMYCALHDGFIREILIGKSLQNDKQLIIEEVDARVHTFSKRALITAIQGVYNHYIMTRKTILNRNDMIITGEL